MRFRIKDEDLEKELKRHKSEKKKWLKEEIIIRGKYAIKKEINNLSSKFKTRKRKLFENKLEYFAKALDSDNPRVKKPALEALESYKRNYPDLYNELVKKYKE